MTSWDEPAKTRVTWQGGRNYYLAEWGEYAPCSGWTYTKPLFIGFHNSLGGPLQVTAQLKVSKWRSRYQWRLSLEVAGRLVSDVEATGKTTSLVSCCRQADAWLENNEAVLLGLRGFYSQKNVTILTLVDASDPVASIFGFSSGLAFHLPYYEYRATGPDGFTWLVEYKSGGVFMRGIDEPQSRP